MLIYIRKTMGPTWRIGIALSNVEGTTNIQRGTMVLSMVILLEFPCLFAPDVLPFTVIRGKRSSFKAYPSC